MIVRGVLQVAGSTTALVAVYYLLLCVPGISSAALTGRVALPAIQT